MWHCFMLYSLRLRTGMKSYKHFLAYFTLQILCVAPCCKTKLHHVWGTGWFSFLTLWNYEKFADFSEAPASFKIKMKRAGCSISLVIFYIKKPLGRPRRRWVDNIRMDIQEVGCGYMDWTGLAQDRDRWRTLVSAVMNLRVPWNVGNFSTSCKPVSCSRRTLHHGVSK